MQVHGSIYIQDNPQLSSLGNLQAALSTLDGFTKINNNPSLPEGQAKALAAKSSVPQNI